MRAREVVVEALADRSQRELAAAAPTYPELRATLGDLPPGYAHLDRARLVGHGRDRFEQAAGLLLSWQVQLRAGLRVRAEQPGVAAGEHVVVGIGVGPVRVWAPCRVLAVVTEPQRRGFVYATLPGHPEVGEEAFLVTRDEHDQVWLRVRAFSRPAPGWPTLVAPAARLAQARVTERYLRSLD